MSDELHSSAKEVAKAHHITVSALIRAGLEQKIQELKSVAAE